MQLNENTIFILDCDNTLWRWIQYAGPAYKAMCKVLSGIAGKEFLETAAAMKTFYTSVGTLEHEGLVQGLQKAGFFKHLPHFNLRETILLAQAAFSEERDRHFKVFDGITEMVRELQALDVRLLLLTDATRYQAMRRLARSRLEGFEKMYCMPAPVFEQMPEDFGATGRLPSIPYEELPEEKPHTDLERILGLTRAEIQERVVIAGDSVKKDVALAERFECLVAHAAYGLASEEDIDAIRDFAPDDVANRNTVTASTASSYHRMVTANHPSEILAKVRAA
ncbi:MAG: HAD family hydrolase [Patescibacteria group bacterium]